MTDQVEGRSSSTSGSLRAGLIGLVIVSLVPIAVASIFVGQRAMEDARLAASSRLYETTRAIADSERIPFIIARHSLRIMATAPAVKGMTAECRDRLVSAMPPDGPIINYARVDMAGRIRCSVVPVDPNRIYPAQPWYTAGLKRRGFSMSGPIEGRLIGEPVLGIMLPILDENGQLDGAITTGLSIRKLEADLEDSLRVPDARAAVVDREGRVLFGDKGVKLDGAQLRQALRGSDLSIEESDRLYAAAPLAGEDLVLVYSEAKATALDATLTAVRLNVALPLAAILLASIALWLGTNHYVLRWLSRLGTLAGRLAGGEDSGLRDEFVRAPREIAALSENFHDMAAAVRQRTSELQQALVAQANLTREVQHRVKNNLQVVSSLLTLQAARVDSEAARHVLSQTMARVGALSLIYRLLYERADSNEEGTVELQTMMTELCGQLRRSRRDAVELHCRSTTFKLPMDSALPLALFVVEAVTNSLRHAFDADTKGTIDVDVRRDDDNLVVSIVDSGKGYDVTKAQTRVGFDLMTAFADQLSGRVESRSAPGKGTSVILTLPMPNEA